MLIYSEIGEKIALHNQNKLLVRVGLLKEAISPDQHAVQSGLSDPLRRRVYRKNKTMAAIGTHLSILSA